MKKLKSIFYLGAALLLSQSSFASAIYSIAANEAFDDKGTSLTSVTATGGTVVPATIADVNLTPNSNGTVAALAFKPYSEGALSQFVLRDAGFKGVVTKLTLNNGAQLVVQTGMTGGTNTGANNEQTVSAVTISKWTLSAIAPIVLDALTTSRTGSVAAGTYAAGNDCRFALGADVTAGTAIQFLSSATSEATLDLTNLATFSGDLWLNGPANILLGKPLTFKGRVFGAGNLRFIGAYPVRFTGSTLGASTATGTLTTAGDLYIDSLAAIPTGNIAVGTSGTACNILFNCSGTLTQTISPAGGNALTNIAVSSGKTINLQSLVLTPITGAAAGLIKSDAGTLNILDSATAAVPVVGAALGTIVNDGRLGLVRALAGISSINNGATLAILDDITQAAATAITVGATGGVIDVAAGKTFTSGGAALLVLNGRLTQTGGGNIVAVAATTVTANAGAGYFIKDGMFDFSTCTADNSLGTAFSNATAATVTGTIYLGSNGKFRAPRATTAAETQRIAYSAN
jgi:hypothetical protein